MSTAPRVIEGKTAVAELVTELDKTRRDLAKSTLALSQTEASSLQLKEALTSKDKLISQLQQEINERDASHRLEVAAVASGSDAHQQVSVQRIQFLENEVGRMKKEVDVAGEYIAQNKQLRTVLTQAHDTLADLQRANTELRSQLASEVQHRTHDLEEEFSKRLLESEQRLRQDAFNALSEEAKVALTGNDKLQTVLQRQNESLDSILERCRHLEAAQTKIEEERKVIESDANTQDREIKRLHRVLGDQTDRTGQLEDALKQRRVERASFELLFVEYNGVKEELVKEKEKSRRAIKEATRWRDKSFTLTEQLGSDDKHEALMKLQAIQQHSELLERNAERNRKRREKLQQARDKNAAIADVVTQAEKEEMKQKEKEKRSKKKKTASVLFGDEETFEDDYDEDFEDDEYYSDDEQEQEESLLEPKEEKLQVNALDILAIWNVNYETEDAGYYDVQTSSSTKRQQNENEIGGAENQKTSSSSSRKKNKSSSSSFLPPVNNNKKSLQIDHQRKVMDSNLSVNSTQKLPFSHNVRKLKDTAAQQQHHSKTMQINDQLSSGMSNGNNNLSLFGVKQQTPLG